MKAIKNFEIYYRSLDKYKKALWIYLFLIFIEGAMRKWFMPGLSNFWMMCRDPIAIWIVFHALQTNQIKEFPTKAFMTIGVITFMTTMFFGHQNLTVALFGFRIWFIHLPLCFIAGRMLNRKDLIMIIRFLVIVFLPMTILYVLQWAAPANSILNAQVGGILSEKETVAYGAVRPSGTFAHCISSSYYNPVIATIFFCMMFSKKYQKIFLPTNKLYIVFAICFLFTLITSVSRGFIIQAVLSGLVITIFLIGIGNHKYFCRLIIGMGFIYILFTFISDINIGGKNLLDPVTSRFEDAAEIEGGAKGIFESRILESYFFYTKEQLQELPLFGYGIGAGSNMGTKTLKIGDGNAWAFGEYPCQIVTSEVGLLFGFIIYCLRIGIPLFWLKKSWKCLKRNRDILPICLWTMALSTFGQGNINLTMTLGWIVIYTVLMISSIRTSKYTVY